MGTKPSPDERGARGTPPPPRLGDSRPNPAPVSLPAPPADEAKRGRKLPNLALLTKTIEAAQLGEAPESQTDDGSRIRDLRLDALWLDHQPREIVPEERLQQLIRERKAQPAALLALLQDAATVDPYHAEILDKLEGLARSIAAEGVLQPIQVAERAGRIVVRDGHRRCLASLIAGRETVPAVQVAEPGELEAVAHALIVNVQREDLTALEKGAALLRLALLVAQRLSEAGTGGESLTLEALLGEAAAADGSASGFASAADGDEESDLPAAGAAAPPALRPSGTARGTDRPPFPKGEGPGVRQPRVLAAQVRDRVCAMVGIQPRTYYRLLALNRLVPEARALARGLTENQLRPLVGLPAEDQPELTGFAVRRKLSAREIGTLAQVVRSGDRDAVRRVMARLTKEEVGRQRTTVSWEPLLHAVPRDVWQRCQALRAELDALPPEHRRTRLDALWEQDRLLLALRAELADIFTAHTYRGPATPLSSDSDGERETD